MDKATTMIIYSYEHKPLALAYKEIQYATLPCKRSKYTLACNFLFFFFFFTILHVCPHIRFSSKLYKLFVLLLYFTIVYIFRFIFLSTSIYLFIKLFRNPPIQLSTIKYVYISASPFTGISVSFFEHIRLLICLYFFFFLFVTVSSSLFIFPNTYSPINTLVSFL